MAVSSQLLRKKLDQIHLANDEASAKSLREFLDRVLADVVPEAKKFGLIAESWQRERNERVIPAAEYIAGLNPAYKGPLFFWEGFHKGCDKSNTIARIADWLLGYAKTPLSMYAAAKDSEQATVVYDAMYKTAQLNPWLKKRLEFKRNLVTSKVNGSRLKVLTSDAGGVAGINPDVLICDELSQWESELFWDGLFGGAMKRSGIDSTGVARGYCLTYVITNAGFKGSWQWKLHEDARTNPLWSFFDGQVGRVYPKWLSPEVIASVRRGMSEWEARRLLDNEWLDPSLAGEKFFSPEDIQACIGAPSMPPDGVKVYLGVDYGEKKDRTALSVVWMDYETGVVHVPEVTVWQGSPENKIKLEDVEQWIDLQMGRFKNAVPVMDPYQTLYMIQRYQKEGKEVKEFEFRGGRANQLMSENLKTLMKNKKIVFSIYTGLVGGSTLADEFRSVIGRAKNYGLRIDHKHNEHDDRVCSVGMAALCAVQEAEPKSAYQRDTEKKVEEDLVEKYIRFIREQQNTDRLSSIRHAGRTGLFGMQ